MNDKILEDIFLDDRLWAEVIEHGVEKHVPMGVLEYIQSPHNRADMCVKIAKGEYHIAPPHTGYRAKDDGGERMFLANEPLDRLLLNAVYKWLNRNERDRIHPLCVSYQQGTGVGQVVRKLAKKIGHMSALGSAKVIGRKYDISKYFETIPRGIIFAELDRVEEHHGKSSVVAMLRDYYNSDVYFDSRQKKTVESYQGIKQGSAVSSWLANVILYTLDERMAGLKGIYYRYSDDIIYVGEDYELATTLIKSTLDGLGLKLNDTKTVDIMPDGFVTFLGFDIRRGEVTLSKKWVKKFQDTVDAITVRDIKRIRRVRAISREHSPDMDASLLSELRNAARRIVRKLFYGDYSWASLALTTINRKEDVRALDRYCLDALRAVYTGKTSIGGLGKPKNAGIRRGKGKHVAANRMATSHIDPLCGYCGITTMQEIFSNRWLVRTLVHDTLSREEMPVLGNGHGVPEDGVQRRIATLETLYHGYLFSRPDGRRYDRFYAFPLEELNYSQLAEGEQRHEMREALINFLANDVSPEDFFDGNTNNWFWQSSKYPQLVLLKKWFKNNTHALC